MCRAEMKTDPYLKIDEKRENLLENDVKPQNVFFKMCPSTLKFSVYNSLSCPTYLVKVARGKRSPESI